MVTRTTGWPNVPQLSLINFDVRQISFVHSYFNSYNNFFLRISQPAAAGFVAAIIHLFKIPPEGDLFTILFTIVSYLLSFLMISNIHYLSLKEVKLSRGKSHLNILFLALLVAGVIWYSEQVLMALAGVYLCSGLISQARQSIKRYLRPKELSPEEINAD